MRILVLTGSSPSISIFRPEAEIFLGFRQAGDEVTILTGRDNPYWDRFVEAGVRMLAFEPKRRISLSAIRFLRRELREQRHEIAYLFNNPAISNTAFAALGLPTFLVTYRGQTGNIHRFDPSCYLTHLHPRVDAISCVANAVRDDLLRHTGRRKKVVTLYKGHDLAWYREAPADLTEFGIPPDAFVIGCTVNNRPRKGIPDLVKAFQRIAEDPRAHLLLAGKGMDDPNLSKLIESGPGAARVHRAGFRRDAPALSAACSCSVLAATKREGLPKSIIESMARGVPAIVTDTGGSAELIEDGVSGFVVPPKDIEALADRLRRMMADPEATRAMGAAARRRIDSHFNVRDTIRNTRTYFQAWLDERALAPRT